MPVLFSATGGKKDHWPSQWHPPLEFHCDNAFALLAIRSFERRLAISGLGVRLLFFRLRFSRLRVSRFGFGFLLVSLLLFRLRFSRFHIANRRFGRIGGKLGGSRRLGGRLLAANREKRGGKSERAAERAAKVFHETSSPVRCDKAYHPSTMTARRWSSQPGRVLTKAPRATRTTKSTLRGL